MKNSTDSKLSLYDSLLDFAESIADSDSVLLGDGLLKGQPVQFAADEFTVDVFGDSDDKDSAKSAKATKMKEALL